jgi:hypothetical protein
MNQLNHFVSIGRYIQAGITALLKLFHLPITCILYVVILPGLTSCEKENAESMYQDSTLLMKVKSGDLVIKELTYTGSGKIHEVLEAYSYKRYSYNAKNQLSKLEIVISINPASCFMPTGTAIEAGADPRKAQATEYTDFEYDASGTLSKRSNYYSNSGVFTLFSYEILEWNDNKISKISTFNPSGALTHYNTYEYDAEGNLGHNYYYTVANDAEDKLIYTHTFEFDTKNNPYRVFAAEGVPGLFTNKNNITKDTYVYNASSGSQYTTNYNYEYNTLGYPVKVNDNAYIYGE